LYYIGNVARLLVLTQQKNWN